MTVSAIAAATRELVRQIREAERERDEAIAHADALADVISSLHWPVRDSWPTTTFHAYADWKAAR